MKPYAIAVRKRHFELQVLPPIFGLWLVAGQ
jgi:hypothetical protein